MAVTPAFACGGCVRVSAWAFPSARMTRSCCGELLIASRPSAWVLVPHTLAALGLAAYWLAIVIVNPTNLAFVTMWMWALQIGFYALTALALAIRHKSLFTWTVRIGLYVVQGCAVGILVSTFVMYARVPALLWRGGGGGDGDDDGAGFFATLGWAHLQDWIAHELPVYLVLLFQLVYLKRVCRRSSNLAERWQERRWMIGLFYLLQVLSHCLVLLLYITFQDPHTVYQGSLSTGEFVALTMGAGAAVNAVAKLGHWRYYSLRVKHSQRTGRRALLATALEDEMDAFADDVDLDPRFDVS